MKTTAFILLLSSSLAFSASTDPFPTMRYKSSNTAWVIPGSPTPSTKLGMTAQEITDWEATHADINFGGSSYVKPDGTLSMPSVGYMYNQAIDLFPVGTQPYWIKNWTGTDRYEELFLHYKEDTPYDMSKLQDQHGSNTMIDGRIQLVGYTSSSSHSGFSLWQKPPWRKSVFSGYKNGGALYVFNFEKLSSVLIDIEPSDPIITNSSVFQIKVEYISACGNRGVSKNTGAHFNYASAWTEVTNLNDGTANFTKSGKLSFDVPKDWQYCSTSDGTGGTYSGAGTWMTTETRDGYGMWTLRISLIVHDENAPLPLLNNMTLPWFIRYTYPNNPSRIYRTIPGWNPANDRDGDGWVNDTEFSDLAFPRATARFQYQSRAIPLGKMWSESSSWCRTNPWSNFTKTTLATVAKDQWAKQKQSGAYNDDMFKLVGPQEYSFEDDTSSVMNPESGIVWEYEPMDGSDPGASNPPRMDSEAIVAPYRKAFAQLLEFIKKFTGSDWLSGNISMMNLLENPLSYLFFKVMDAVLREDQLKPWLGFTGWHGLARCWDIFIYAAQGKKNMIQVLLASARASYFGNTQQNWEGDVYSGTILYYFLNVPGYTALQVWGNGFWYGSGLTTSINWYEADIPMNMAYQPRELLNADLGVPDLNWIPTTPIPYHTKQPGVCDFCVFFNSTSTWVQNPNIANGDNVSVVPSMMYFAWMEHWDDLFKSRMIVARKYTKGLVLLHMSIYGGNKDTVENSLPVELELNSTYRQVFVNGTRGPILSNISIALYEGAILELVVPDTSPSPTQTSVPITTQAPLLTTTASPPRNGASEDQRDCDCGSNTGAIVGGLIGAGVAMGSIIGGAILFSKKSASVAKNTVAFEGETKDVQGLELEKPLTDSEMEQQSGKGMGSSLQRTSPTLRVADGEGEFFDDDI